MKIQQYEGHATINAAVQYSNGQVWNKVMTLPQGFEVSSIITVSLKNAGSPNLNVNGSVTPVIFEYVVPSTNCFALAEIAVVIADAAITPTKFGGIAGPLTNGITWQVVDDTNTLKCDFCPSGSIKQNFEFALATASDLSVTGGADQLMVLWRGQNYGVTAILRAGWKVRITVRDNLTTLDAFQASVTGALTLNDFVQAF